MEHRTSSPEPGETPPAQGVGEAAVSITAAELFRTFTVMGLYGFGGVMPWAHRILVERKRWLDDREFAELLSLGQILPGPNITNLAVMFGYRCSGVRGAGAAVGGLLSLPFFIVLLLGGLYHRYGDVPAVQGALRGMTAVAAGLIFVTGLKLARKQPRTRRGLLFGALALICVGGLQWSLPLVMAVLIPVAIGVEWRARA
ncbi:chromate transporter [Pandoraea sp.]|uniref:chromate transporter n=1 Tax=Pandoraea sp. TaxID=1883445 RepID=UPI00120415B1|nr:chromate transporter [Pandoraea sp.]TAL54860.1 MAG: chromate transporter [Pandoraea sp.]TAM18372.1 MAG: chromate transporter [Pandoraea sp.]